MVSKTKQVRVEVAREVRRARWALGELWSEAVDPLDRAVCRTILRSDLTPGSQVRLLRAWLALR